MNIIKKLLACFKFATYAFVIPVVTCYISSVYRGGVWQARENIKGFRHRDVFINAWNRYFHNKGSEIPINLNIAGIPYFPHGEVGIFISKDAVIGKNAVIFQHVTIGSNTIPGSNYGAPIIGDNCYIGAGAKIIGNVKIGNNCRIGANTCVYTDMQDNSTAVNSPTRIIVKDSLNDNTFYSIDGKKYDFDKRNFTQIVSKNNL